MKILLSLALLAVGFNAGAQQLSPEGCQALSNFVYGVAQQRDAGDSRAHKLEQLDRYVANDPRGAFASNPELKQLFVRQIEHVFDNPQSAPQELAGDLLAECYENAGNLGTPM